MSVQTEIDFPLVRTTDPLTSHDAATVIAEGLSALQREVLAAFRCHGGAMSARQCERLREFRYLAPSTCRKRISELHRLGKLVESGEESVSGAVACTTYRIASGA